MLRRKAPRIIIRYSSAAARSVADNNDLLLEILLRLPIRSLLRFKSVSKRWLSLISDPDFSHRRTISHPPTPSGIFLSRPYPISPKLDFIDLRPNPPRVPFESLEFSLPKHGITISDSCNGLLLCVNEGRRYPKSDYYILNPTTKQYTTLQIERTREIISLSLAFDPLRSSNYKVVCIRISDANNCTMIDIYSSYTGFWRRCNGVFPAPLIWAFHCGVYWNEGIHFWENCLYFDLHKEKLHELTMPQGLKEENRKIEYFGNCCGNLNLIVSYGVEAMELDVYEMEDDHCGWYMKYKVDLHRILSSGLFPRMGSSIEEIVYSIFTVVAIVDQSKKVGEEEEEPYVVFQSLGKAVRVNVKSGRFEELVFVLNDIGTTKFPMGFGIITPFLYIESLACV